VGEIVSLRRERKRIARARDAEKAQENRAMFGRTKAERVRDDAASLRAATFLDRFSLSADTTDHPATDEIP